MLPKDKIKQLRLLSGYFTLEQFEKDFGFSKNTLQAIELGRSSLTYNNAKKLAIIFQKAAKIACTPEWLLEDSDALLNHHKENIEKTSSLKLEADFFQAIHKDAIFCVVLDDIMEPFLSKGDLVAGFPLSNDQRASFTKGICIIKYETEFIVRLVQRSEQENKFNITAFNIVSSASPIFLREMPISLIVPLKWLRKP